MPNRAKAGHRFRGADGEYLPLSGFGSYRLTLHNSPLENKYTMPFVQGDGAFKIFANGVLVTQCGVPGRRETPSVRSTSAYTIANSFSSDQEGTIVLVHEVGDLHN